MTSIAVSCASGTTSKATDTRGSWFGRIPREGDSPAYYAIYFDVVKPGERSGESPIPLLGDGDALFTDRSDGFLITALHCKPTMCDWNGDGLLDLLVGEIQGHIFYFENIGTKREPKFARGRFLMLDGKPLRFEHYTTPCAVDWNDDGKLDLLVGRAMGGQILFLENVGTRTEPKLALRGNVEADGKPITLPPQLNPGETFLTQEYMAKPEVVDWNGDGYKDLLVGGYVSGAIFYYENVRKEKGIPKLVARGPISADGKALRVGSAASPCAADFSGNGLLDLITARGNIVMGQSDPSGITYFKNVGTRASPDLKERPFPFTQPCHVGIAAVPCAADWNGDGLLDLVIGNMDHVQLYRNVGGRTEPRFELAQTLKNQWGPVRTGGFSTSPADWNGDGNLDLVYALNGHIELKLNVDPRNPPRWKEAGVLNAGGKPINYVFPLGDAEMFPLIVDFNRDGLPDLVLGLADGYVWYYKNIGTRTEPKLAEGVHFRLSNGGFVKIGRYKEGDTASDFASHSGDRSCPKVADFNGDGVNDLMVSDAYGDVTYFENVGSNEKPVFAPGVKVLHESPDRAMIAVTDWDHDGRVDIILPLQDSIYLYRNVGKGREQRFQRDRELVHQYIPYPNPYVVDWNGDGDEDLLVSSSYGVCYLLNDRTSTADMQKRRSSASSTNHSDTADPRAWAWPGSLPSLTYRRRSSFARRTRGRDRGNSKPQSAPGAAFGQADFADRAMGDRTRQNGAHQRRKKHGFRCHGSSPVSVRRAARWRFCILWATALESFRSGSWN